MTNGPKLTDVVAVDVESLRKPDACWIGTEPAQGWERRLHKVAESTTLEVVVSLCVLADVVITVLSFVLADEFGESLSVFCVSSAILIVLCFDVALRMAVERLAFFRRPLNWIELFVATAGLVSMFIEIQRMMDSGSVKRGQQSFAFGRMIRPALRLFRVLRVFIQILFVKGGVKGRLDRQADRIVDKVVRKKMQELMWVPKENIVVRPSQGIFHLEKAQVRSNVFAGVHLPLTIVGGIFDLVHVHVELKSRSGKEKRELDESSHDSHRLRICVESAILVVGPGHHQERSAPPWDFDTVMQRKEELISLAAKGMDKLVKPKPKGREGGRRKQRQRLGQWMKKRAKAVADEVIAHGMLISFGNVEVRFEDAGSQLWGTHTAIGGIRLGTLQLRARGSMNAQEFLEELSFRSNGRWRPSITKAASDKLGDAKGMITLPDEPPSPLGSPMASPKASPRALSRLGSMTGSFVSGKPRLKRSLKHGVRGALHVDRLCVFWDHMPSSVSAEAAGRYSEQLRAGTGHSMHTFLEQRWRENLRERWRLAACEGLARLDRRVAAERLRKLRERVASHRYLVLPFSSTVHVFYKPQGPITSEVWQPSLDVNVHMPRVMASIDLEMAASIMRIKDYISRWVYQDSRFQWMPPPRHLGGGTAYDLWTFALRSALHAIDKQHPWRTLAWILLKRRSTNRSKFVEALTEWPAPDLHTAAVQQVGLPLSDIFLARQEAAAVNAARKQEIQASKRAWRTRYLPSSTKSFDGDFDESIPARSSLPSRSSLASTVTTESSFNSEVRLDVDDDEGPTRRSGSRFTSCSGTSIVSDDNLKAADRPGGGGLIGIPSQLHLKLDTATFCVLMAPQGAPNRPLVRRRRAMLRVDYGGISLAAASSAPKPVWISMAPPALVLGNEQEDPTDVLAAMEAGIDTMTGVLGSAPSDAPQLRRMFGASRASRADAAAAKGKDGKEPNGVLAMDPIVRWRGIMTLGDARPPAMGDAGPPATGEGKPKKPPRFLQFAMCVQPMEVCLVKPLLQSILRTLKSPGTTATPGRGEPSRDASKTTSAGQMSRDVSKTSSTRSPSKGRAAPYINGVFDTGNMSLFSGREGPTDRMDRVSSDRSERSTMGLLPISSLMSMFMSQASKEPPPVLVRKAVATPKQTGEEIRRFWADIAELRKKRAEQRRLRKKVKKTEKFMGIAGPSSKILRGGSVSGRILFVRGFQGTVYVPYSMGNWMLQTVTLPPGTVEVEHGGQPATLACSFRSSAEALGHRRGGLPVRTEDGWWFESEHEARRVSAAEAQRAAASKAAGANGSMDALNESTRSWNGFDDTCAGEAALEEQEQSGYDFGSAFSVERQGAKVSPRYKPSASATGLPPPLAPTAASAWSKKRGSTRIPEPTGLLAPCDHSPLACCTATMGNPMFISPKSTPAKPLLRLDSAFQSNVANGVVYGTARHSSFADRSQVEAEVLMGFECRPAKEIGLPHGRALEAWWKALGLLRPRPDPDI